MAPKQTAPKPSDTQQASFADPKWFGDFLSAYKSGKAQCFILHLNVRDYAVPGLRLTPYLTQKLSKREVIAVYNRSEGISFPLPSHREQFMTVLGLGQDTQQAAANPALAALGMGGPVNNAPAELPTSPSSALPLLERLLRSTCKATVIIEMAEKIVPAADVAAMSPDDRTILVTLERWGTDKSIEQSGNFVFLQTNNLASLHSDLRSASAGYTALEVPLPDRANRRTFIDWHLDGNEVNGMELSAEELANSTAGLSLVHIENIFLTAKLEGSLTRRLVRKEKAAIIETEYAGLLEVMDPIGGFEVVGGMQHIKDWVKERIVTPARENRTQDLPKGVLWVGPPGTGKTFFIKALAKELGWNAVALNLENILGGIVGTSERNLARALAVIKSLAPVMVFMDEIDQSDVSSRGNGSGNPVAKNLFSMMLRFMSDPDNRGSVLFNMASNRPDLVDAAFMRFGRVDAIIPMLLGDKTERIGAIGTQVSGQGATIAADALDYLAQGTDLYSNADIEAVVSKSRLIAAAGARKELCLPDVTRALRTLRPATVKNAEWYTNLAIDACNDTDLLPARYAEALNDRVKLKEQIEAQAPAETRRRGAREL